MDELEKYSLIMEDKRMNKRYGDTNPNDPESSLWHDDYVSPTTPEEDWEELEEGSAERYNSILDLEGDCA